MYCRYGTPFRSQKSIAPWLLLLHPHRRRRHRRQEAREGCLILPRIHPDPIGQYPPCWTADVCSLHHKCWMMVVVASSPPSSHSVLVRHIHHLTTWRAATATTARREWNATINHSKSQQRRRYKIIFILLKNIILMKNIDVFVVVLPPSPFFSSFSPPWSPHLPSLL